MRRIVLLITICCQVFWVAAQKKAPKWMDKQRKAVVTVTTYGKDNQKKASGTGFFITETGEALSGYSLFKDAARATVTDADGKEYPVSYWNSSTEAVLTDGSAVSYTHLTLPTILRV